MNRLLEICSAKAATAPISGATLRLQRILVVDEDLDRPRSSEKRWALKTQVRPRPANVVCGVRKLPNPIQPWSESESEVFPIADRGAEAKNYIARFNKTKTVVYD